MLIIITKPIVYLEDSMKKILKICITLSFTFLLTGCVDCLVSLNYSKIKKPTLYGELTIEPQILEKYSMSISQIKKQLLDYDFFKDWTIKKQTDSSLSIESPTSFIKEISTLTKQNNKYIFYNYLNFYYPLNSITKVITYILLNKIIEIQK